MGCSPTPLPDPISPNLIRGPRTSTSKCHLDRVPPCGTSTKLAPRRRMLAPLHRTSPVPAPVHFIKHNSAAPIPTDPPLVSHRLRDSSSVRPTAPPAPAATSSPCDTSPRRRNSPSRHAPPFRQRRTATAAHCRSFWCTPITAAHSPQQTAFPLASVSLELPHHLRPTYSDSQIAIVPACNGPALAPSPAAV